MTDLDIIEQTAIELTEKVYGLTKEDAVELLWALAQLAERYG